MKSPISPFYFKLSVLSLVLEWLVLGLYYLKNEYFNWFLFAIPIYFLLLFVFFHSQLLKTTNKRAQAFVNTYMLLTGIKLFLNLGVLMVFMFSLKNNVVSFAISFLIQYFLFTGFEIKELLKIFSRNDKVPVKE